MHDLIYAVAFLAMVASPAMVAAFGGRKESEPGPEVRSPRRPASRVQSAGIAKRRGAMRRIALAGPPVALHDGPTLPVHHARGLSNR